MIRQFTTEGWKSYIYWQKTDRAILKKVDSLIDEICRTPYEGSGKPEMLKYEMSGYWSRRINHEHRLVYVVSDETVTILSCRFHCK